MSDNTKKDDHSFRHSIAFNLIAIGVAIVILLFFTMEGLRIYTRHGNEIEVPSLKGLTTEQAVQKLKRIGLEVEIDDSVYIRQLAPNTIYSQSLSAGSHVKTGRIIHLTINTAQPPTIPMPDIADNSSEREAEMRLTILGLKLGPVEHIKGEKNWVYGVKVNGRNTTAGTRIPADAIVTLVVGDGTFYDEDVQEISDGGTSDSMTIDDQQDLTSPTN